MEAEKRDLLTALAAVQAGRLDSLAPEQLTRLAAFLDANAGARAALANHLPEPEIVFQIPAPNPSPTAWARVWRAVETAEAVAPNPPTSLSIRFLRPALAAAAVCALLVGLWSLQRATSVPEWPVAWATQIEINELEVSDGATPLVICTESEGSIPVIWLMDEGG